MAEIDFREVPQVEVISAEGNATAQTLGTFITETLAQLRTKAAVADQPAPFFVVYHGEVDDDSDGPVEVCLPVSSTVGLPDDCAARIEPAHLEAFLPFTKAEAEAFGLREALGRLTSWSVEQSRQPAGPPRSVHHRPLAEAGDDDIVGELALPIN